MIQKIANHERDKTHKKTRPSLRLTPDKLEQEQTEETETTDFSVYSVRSCSIQWAGVSEIISKTQHRGQGGQRRSGAAIDRQVRLAAYRGQRRTKPLLENGDLKGQH